MRAEEKRWTFGKSGHNTYFLVERRCPGEWGAKTGPGVPVHRDRFYEMDRRSVPAMDWDGRCPCEW